MNGLKTVNPNCVLFTVIENGDKENLKDSNDMISCDINNVGAYEEVSTNETKEVFCHPLLQTPLILFQMPIHQQLLQPAVQSRAP